MPDKEESEEARAWLLEPEGRAGLHIAIGSDAELHPDVRAALEGLLRALEETEVAGFSQAAYCKEHIYCGKKGDCQPLVVTPCVMLISCRVADFA